MFDHEFEFFSEINPSHMIYGNKVLENWVKFQKTPNPDGFRQLVLLRQHPV